MYLKVLHRYMITLMESNSQIFRAARDPKNTKDCENKKCVGVQLSHLELKRFFYFLSHVSAALPVLAKLFYTKLFLDALKVIM